MTDLLLVAMLSLVSCHKSQSEVLVSKEIDCEQGGSAITPDGAVMVSIPAHAITQSATLTISRQAKPPASEGKSYLASVGDCYAIQLGAGEVVDSIEIAFAYDDLDLPSGVGIEDLSPAYYDSTQGHWVRLGSTQDSTSKRLAVRTMHLSEWQLRAYKAKQRVVSVWVAHWTAPPSDLLTERPFISSVCLPCTVASTTSVSPVLQTVSPGGDGQVRLITLFFKCDANTFLDELSDGTKMRDFTYLVAERTDAYDGVDLDLEEWDQLAPARVLKYVALIANLRASLGSEKILSVTMQHGWLDPTIQALVSVLGWADEFRLMAYDYNMPGRTDPGPVAPLDQVTADLDRFSGPFGIFKSKILLGIPMYHYQWSPDGDGGLLAGLAKGCEITADRTQARPGEQVGLHVSIPSSPAIQWDPVAKNPNFVTRDGRQVYTENVRSISYKMYLALTKGIRGVCFWHYAAGDGDTRSAKLWNAISRYEAGTLPQPGDPSTSDLGVTWTVVDPHGGTETPSSRNSEVTWTVPSGDSGTYKLVASLPSDPTEIAVSDSVEVNVTSSGNQPGTLKWSLPMGADYCHTPAVGTGGVIYVGSSGSTFYAVNPEGTVKWTFPAPNAGPAAIGADGTIYVPSEDRNVYAINPDGARMWAYPTVDAVSTAPAIGGDGTIYVGTFRGLHAICPDGSPKWTFPCYTDHSPAIASDGTIYAGLDTCVLAVNADGTLKWAVPARGMLQSDMGFGNDGTIYVGSDYDLCAISPEGIVRWSFPTGGYVTTGPVIGGDGTVYFHSQDECVYAVNPNGTLRWTFPAYWPADASPAVAEDGTVYVGCATWSVCAINPDGTLKWSFPTSGGFPYSSPAIGEDGTVYIGASGGNLYALHGSSALSNSGWPKFQHDNQNTGRVSGGK